MLGCIGRSIVTTAQLTTTIVTPAPDGTGTFEGTKTRCTRGNIADSCQRATRHINDGDSARTTVIGTTVTEGAATIVTPTLDLTRRQHRTATSGTHRHFTGSDAWYLHGHRCAPAEIGAITGLPIRVIAPAPYRATSANRTDMGWSHAELGDPIQVQNHTAGIDATETTRSAT